MKSQVFVAAIAGAVGGMLTVGAGSRMFTARADLPPADSRLFYSGVLVDENGVPVTGMRSISVQLFNMATNGSMICGLQAEPVQVQAGNFRVRLDPACGTVLDAATSPSYVQLTINGEPVPPANAARPPVAAVPYALQSDHAARADIAARASTISAGAGLSKEAFARVHVANVCSTDPCQITSQFGGITTVNRTAAGVYKIHFPVGLFSSAPTCVASSGDNVGKIIAVVFGATTSSVDVSLFADITATSADEAFQLICMGPQ